MKKLENITTDAIQQHTIPFGDEEITIVLKYSVVTQTWMLDVAYKEKSINGSKLSIGTLHIEGAKFALRFYRN